MANTFVFQSLFFWNNLNNITWVGAASTTYAVSILILLEQSQQLFVIGADGVIDYVFQSLFFWNNLNNPPTPCKPHK